MTVSKTVKSLKSGHAEIAERLSVKQLARAIRQTCIVCESPIVDEWMCDECGELAAQIAQTVNNLCEIKQPEGYFRRLRLRLKRSKLSGSFFYLRNSQSKGIDNAVAYLESKGLKVSKSALIRLAVHLGMLQIAANDPKDVAALSQNLEARQ